MKKHFFALCLALSFGLLSTQADDRPNIVWIIPDDMSASFSTYGETAIDTPHVDALAKRGVQFNNAHVTAPVCSTCGSTPTPDGSCGRRTS